MRKKKRGTVVGFVTLGLEELGVILREKTTEDMVSHGVCRKQTGRRGFVGKIESMQAWSVNCHAKVLGMQVGVGVGPWFD